MSRDKKHQLKHSSSMTHLRKSAYTRDVEALSYKQLLRISSAVNASSEKEKAASKLFYHSLTPPEMRIVKAIQTESSVNRRISKIAILKHSLRRKNAEELVNVNIDDILHDAKKNDLL